MSTFDYTIALHGQIYHFVSALLPHLRLIPTYLSVSFHDTDFVSQTGFKKRAMPHLRPQLLQWLTALLHEMNRYVLSVVSIREGAVRCNEPSDFRMVIHKDW